MSRLNTFKIPIEVKGQNDSVALLEKKNALRKRMQGKMTETELSEFFMIMEGCRKSARTKMEDESKEEEWTDHMYSRLYSMALDSIPEAVINIVKMKALKFSDESMPVNYITSILRQGIQKKSTKDSLISVDMSKIRSFIVDNGHNLSTVRSKVPMMFMNLTMSVNRMNVDKETKKYLNGVINSAHERFQKWISTMKD